MANKKNNNNIKKILHTDTKIKTYDIPLPSNKCLMLYALYHYDSNENFTLEVTFKQYLPVLSYCNKSNKILWQSHYDILKNTKNKKIQIFKEKIPPFSLSLINISTIPKNITYEPYTIFYKRMCFLQKSFIYVCNLYNKHPYKLTKHSYDKHYNRNNFRTLLDKNNKKQSHHKKIKSKRKKSNKMKTLSYYELEHPNCNIKDIERYYFNLINFYFFHTYKFLYKWHNATYIMKKKYYRKLFIHLFYEDTNKWKSLIPTLVGNEIIIPVDWNYSKAICVETRKYCTNIIIKYKSGHSYFDVGNINYTFGDNDKINKLLENLKIMKNNNLIHNKKHNWSK